MTWHGEYEFGADGTTVCDVVVTAINSDDIRIDCGDDLYQLHISPSGVLTVRHSSGPDYVWVSAGMDAVIDLKGDGLWLDIPTYWRNRINMQK